MQILFATLSALLVANAYAEGLSNESSTPSFQDDKINHSKVPGESTVMPSPASSAPGVSVPAPDELTIIPAPSNNPTPSPQDDLPTVLTPSPKMDSPTPNMDIDSNQDNTDNNSSDTSSNALPAPESPSPSPSRGSFPDPAKQSNQTVCPPTCGLDPSTRIFFQNVKADIEQGLTCDHFHDTCETLEERGGCDCSGCNCSYTHDPTRKHTSTTASLQTSSASTTDTLKSTMESTVVTNIDIEDTSRKTSLQTGIPSTTTADTVKSSMRSTIVTSTDFEDTTTTPLSYRTSHSLHVSIKDKETTKIQNSKFKMDEGRVPKKTYESSSQLPSCFSRCGSTRPIMSGLDYCFCDDKCITESNCCHDYEETCVGGEAKEDERAVPNPVSPAAIIIISISIILVVTALAGCAGYVIIRRKTRLKGVTSTFTSHSLTDSNSSLLGPKSME